MAEPARVLPAAPPRVTPTANAVRPARTLSIQHLALAAAMGVFILHATNYLFFFVDDEGIPFVFARHLLEGKGLVYNSFEGRVEGYSDFFQVLLSAVWLKLTATLGLGPLAPFFVGKAVSFVAGIGTVALVWHAIRRTGATTPGLTAGLGFLAFFAPLAAWSCSSLEIAAVGLLVIVITLGLLVRSPRWDAIVALASCAFIVLRIDGFIYVGALLAPAVLAAGPERRRTMLLRIVDPVMVMLLVYHVWRVWYFGDWMTSPIEAKILYKLRGAQDVMTKAPPAPYLQAFLETYGLLPAAIGLGLLVACCVLVPSTWTLLATIVLMVCYIGLVGDWMAGFRFMVPVAPVMAVLIAMAISSIRRTAIAWAAAASLVLWCGGVALAQSTAYDGLEYRDSWWLHPSLDPDRFFGQYLALSRDLADVIPPGTVTAYNQAGFVPYMLDLENFDDLGICSRFVARLPTTDSVFTEVGRYSPLTNKTAVRAAHAYVLYRAPEFVIEPLDNLRSANGGGIPEAVLRGHYGLVVGDRRGQAAVYRRVSTAPEFQTNPHMFLENLATPSRLVRAFDGSDVPAGERLTRLAFLADGALDRTFSGSVSYDVVFARSDLPIYELDLEGAWSRTDVAMTIALEDSAGRAVVRDERVVAADQSANVTLSWPEGIRAAELVVKLETTKPGDTRVILHDLRVQGQSPELAAYVAKLRFPPGN